MSLESCQNVFAKSNLEKDGSCFHMHNTRSYVPVSFYFIFCLFLSQKHTRSSINESATLVVVGTSVIVHSYTVIVLTLNSKIEILISDF
uniref:Uncharacterized protein n=1 Tax=Physcomitrium patens TaxID=3218 RepID=A0A2K1KC29_PHYPA|nr:hypothetical protein PHYPA_010513 [Physcomitrium patens]